MNEPIEKRQLTERLNYITLAQIVSMILIVLSHSVPDKMESPSFITASIPFLQKAGLVTFMSISGYLTTYTRQLDKYGYRIFIRKRTIRLLIPYFVISISLLVPKYLLSSYSSVAVSINPFDVLWQLAVPREGLLPHLWFLPTLWLLSCLLPLWEETMKNRIITVSMLGVLFLLQFVPVQTNFLCINDLLRFSFWFYIGLNAGRCGMLDKLTDTNVKLIIMIFIIVGGAGCILSWFFWGKSHFTWRLYEILSVAIIISGSIVFAAKEVSIYRNFGKYTYTIYILSLPIQGIAGIFCLKVGIPAGAACCILFILGLFTPILVARIAELIDSKLGRRLFSTIIGM